MAFTEIKGWLASRTIWGLIAIAIPLLQQIYEFLLQVPEGLLPKEAQIIIQALGVILAAYGRYKAKKEIKGIA